MTITQINDIVTKEEEVFVILLEKESIVSKLTKSSLQKILLITKFKNKKLFFFEIDKIELNHPLPVILFYRSNRLIDKLIGFHTTKYYTNWFKKIKFDENKKRHIGVFY